MPEETNEPVDQGTMPITKHLEELRKRIIISFLAIAVGFCVCFAFADRLFNLLKKPWVDANPKWQFPPLIYTAPHEAFFTYMKVAFMAGSLLAVPVIFLQIWRFIAPGLYQHEKRYLLPVVFFTSVCFISGSLFGYFVVFPTAYKFFLTYATPDIAPMMKVSEYLSFSSKMLFAFGFAFELPVFAFFLGKIGILSHDFLKRKRKIAIVLVFVAAAALTPSPDVVSQLLMAGPLLVLYEISIWVVYWTAKKAESESKELVKEE